MKYIYLIEYWKYRQDNTSTVYLKSSLIVKQLPAKYCVSFLRFVPLCEGVANKEVRRKAGSFVPDTETNSDPTPDCQHSI